MKSSRPWPTLLLRTLAALLVGAVGLPAAAPAQIIGHAEVLTTNRYLWRGIRRAAGWNAQAQTSAAVVNGPTQLSTGVWSTFELSTHRDGSLTELRRHRWGLAEYDLWLEAAHRLHPVDLALGIIWYEYRGAAGNAGTGEIYARVRGTTRGRVRVSPELSLWYDPVKRNAAYLEGGLTAPLLALPFLKPTLIAYTTLEAGAVLGRPDRPSALAPSSFRGSGLAFGDASIGVRVGNSTGIGNLFANLSGHLFFARDSSTRRPSRTTGRLGHDVRTFGMLEVGISWPPTPER